MGKTKSAGQKLANTTAKQMLHDVKNGSVKKNKNPKFKNTSMSKSALIDNAKAQNKNASPQRNPQENVNSKNNQNLFKGKIKQSKKKGESPKGKQNSPNASQNKHLNKKNNLEPKKDLAEMDDSDSDIDEGVVPQEYSVESIDEIFEDEEESDTDVPNIFGTSLAEDSDEDDDDFEDEKEKDGDDEEDDDSYEEEEGSIEHKGVKMFKGIKSKAENKNLGVSEDEDDDEEDECSDNDDEDDMDETDEEIESSQINTSLSGIEDDEDCDEEEEEDDEDEDSEGDEAKCAALVHDTLGIKALLGKTIADDDDDEDFNEDDEDDEDDDISDEDDDDEENDSMIKALKKTKDKASPVNEKQAEKKELSAKEQEIDKCTICIDNIPKDTKVAKIKKVFGQYGPINNVRLRGIIPQNPKMSKKVAAITGQIHPKVTTIMAFVNYKSQESAKKALSMSGKLFEGNYVSVNIAAKSEKPKYDHKKAVFIGNLKFGMESNVIWKRFSECGEIESVYLMRDNKTGQSRGHGYVNFKSQDAVALALKLDGVEICNRPVRVSPCLNKENEKTSNKKGRKRQLSGKGDGNNPVKKFKDNSQKIKAHPAQHEANVKKQQKSQKGNEKVGGKNSASSVFQGQTAGLKEKKKGSKFDKKKKIMAEKLKPKKAAKA